MIANTDLPEPDFAICGVGTMIYDFKAKTMLKEFSEVMEEGWDKGTIESIVQAATNAVRQPPQFQHRYKSSWYLEGAEDEAIQQLEDLLNAEGVTVNLVYSSARDLDVLPKMANKGNSLRWLLDELGIKAHEVVVAGDTGNDSAMFLIPGVRGIVVENAQPELSARTLSVPTYPGAGALRRRRARGPAALRCDHARSPSTTTTNGPSRLDPAIQRIFDEEHVDGLSREDIELLETGVRQGGRGAQAQHHPAGLLRVFAGGQPGPRHRCELPQRLGARRVRRGRRFDAPRRSGDPGVRVAGPWRRCSTT